MDNPHLVSHYVSCCIFVFPSTDTFHRSAKFVGHLKAVKVYHDGGGIFPNWHLDRVS